MPHGITHCYLPPGRGDMACYIPRWYTRPKTVTHPSTNRARRALTLFLRRTPLTTTPCRQPAVAQNSLHPFSTSSITSRHLVDFMLRGKMTEADAPTIRMDATPSGLSVLHIHHPPHFHTSLEKEIMQGTMPGARRRGRPRTAWMDNIKTWTGLPVEESVRMTEDRDKWR